MQIANNEQAENNDRARGNFADLSKKPNYRTGEVPSDEVLVLIALGIYQAGCYCECPDNLGCATNCALLCCSCDQLACKTVRKEEKTTACCVLNRTNCECQPSLALLKYRAQFCCSDIRCAIPTGPQDYEYPAMCNVFGLTCCFNCKPSLHCCAKTGTIRSATAPMTATTGISPT